MLAVGGTLFGRRAKLLVDLVRLGKPVERFDDVPERVRNEAVIVLGQKKLLQRLVPGLIHAAIFWGFLVLFPTIVIAMIGAVSRDATLPWLGHQGWFALMVDVFAVLVLVGVIGAVAIRKIQRPARFEGSHLREADLILALIAGIVTTLLLWHASRIALGLNEWPESWSPVSNALSGLFGDGDVTEVLERVFVWAHVLIIVSFLAYLPHSKHLHIATAAFNVYFARTRARGRLEPLRFDVPEEEMRFGAGTVPDLTWKQTLDTFSCTECGRCQDVCPAWTTGKELSPKLLIMALRDQVFEEGPRLIRGEEGFEPSPLVPNAVTDNVVWDCVTCGACVRECPVSIEHVDHIIDLRRHLVMMDSSFPAESEQMLRDVERASNPWGKPQTERADWAAELGVRVLEPGDPAPGGALLGGLRGVVRRARAHGRPVNGQAAEGRRRGLRDPRPARVVHRRPRAADRQRVPVPGARGAERRHAERGGRDEDRGELPALLQHAGQRVLRTSAVTTRSCTTPSCSPTWCARAGSRRPATPARSPTTTPATWPATTTCAPTRASWSRRSGRRSRWSAAASAPSAAAPEARTCGWRSAPGMINEERAREAAETGAETLAVACPFCTVMLDDGVRARGDELRVVDVSTLLAESLEPGDEQQH